MAATGIRVGIPGGSELCELAAAVAVADRCWAGLGWVDDEPDAILRQALADFRLARARGLCGDPHSHIGSVSGACCDRLVIIWAELPGLERLLVSRWN